MVRTTRPVCVFQTFIHSALADISSESSWETASARTAVRCPGASIPGESSRSTPVPSAALSWTASIALLVRPTSTLPVAAQQSMETAFAPQRCVLTSASSSAARVVWSSSAPSSASSPSSASAASAALAASPFFFVLSSTRFFLRRWRFLTSLSPKERKTSTVLPAPWHRRTSRLTPFGRQNWRPTALPWPSGRGMAPMNVASSSPALTSPSRLSDQTRRNLSAEPATRRVWLPLRARDQTSAWCSEMVCRQICSSTDQMRTKRSLEALMTLDATAPSSACSGPSQKSTAVTWSTCPRSRATPLSAVMSQRTMSVSQAPEARRWPERSKARHETADRWPCSVCSSAPRSKSHSRTAPSP
mmetsp:Transcript_14382/g.42989  ORF Transcript_14382/g.42989 Transcript_14382/m.42989 type:complete len:359 (+) Transcript_14382:1577-2653(+)